MNYTKGGWEVTRHPPLDNLVVVLLGDKPYNDSGICQVDYLSDKEEMLANANLIAAAPDCYMELKVADATICELCKRLNPQHEHCTSCEDRASRLKALLKAEGGNNDRTGIRTTIQDATPKLA